MNDSQETFIRQLLESNLDLGRSIEDVKKKTNSIDKKVAVIETDLRHHIEGTVQNRNEIRLLRKMVDLLEDQEVSRRAVVESQQKYRAKVGWYIAAIAGTIAIVSNFQKILDLFN
jgi:hypothetical protein